MLNAALVYFVNCPGFGGTSLGTGSQFAHTLAALAAVVAVSLQSSSSERYLSEPGPFTLKLEPMGLINCDWGGSLSGPQINHHPPIDYRLTLPFYFAR